MTTADVGFHLFAVETSDGGKPLTDRIKQIERDALDKRIRQIRQADIRLDAVSKRTLKRGGVAQGEVYYLDFTRMRDTHGPGRVSKEKPVEGFDLDPEDFFGEETAALWLPQTKHLIVQFNHFGPKAQSIADYLGSYIRPITTYELKPKLDRDAERRFKKQAEVRKIQLSIDLTKMTKDDLKNGMAFAEAAKLGTDLNAARMQITISVGHDPTGKLTQRAKDSIVAALGWKRNAVTSATVSGRATPGGEIEAIDLLEHKLTHVQQITAGADRRLPQNSRWNALAQARLTWKSVI